MAAKQGISEGEYETWLPPRGALGFLRSAIPGEYAVPEIIKRLRTGLLRSAAKIVLVKTYRDTLRSDFALILPVAWQPDGLMNANHTLWATATFHCEMAAVGLRGVTEHWTFHGVRLDPKGLQEILDAAAPQVAQSPFSGLNTPRVIPGKVHLPSRPATLTGVPTPEAVSEPKKPHAGGRPLKFGWEHAINAIWKVIYEGKFIPSKQADIEGRLGQWFIDNDLEEPGPTQRRERARMIWKAFKSED